MEIKNNSQIAFNGMLYGKMGSHITKGIMCCPHGDGKFVRFITKIGSENPDSIKVSYLKDGLDKLVIETKEIPKLNLFEKIFYRVTKSQKKAIKMRESGKIESFIFKMNELEYKNLKKSYPFITSKQLKKFKQIVKLSAPADIQQNLNYFLW